MNDSKTEVNAYITGSRKVLKTISYFLTFFVLIQSMISEAKEIEKVEAISPEYSQIDSLTGAWGGTRSKMAEKGVIFEFEFYGDISSMSGGIREETEYLANIDLELHIDAKKLMG